MGEAVAAGILSYLVFNPTGMMLVLMGVVLLVMLMWKHFDASPWAWSPKRVIDVVVSVFGLALIALGIYTMIAKDELELREKPPEPKGFFERIFD